MSSNGGGGSNLLDMGLMIAAGVAAPELAPVLMEGGAAGLGLGATAATGITGAALSGAVAAATGQNVARSALMGGAGGALSGALAPAGDVVGGGAGGSLDTTGQAAGSSALNNPEAGSLVQGNITPQQLSQGVSSGLYTPEQAAQYGQAYSGAFSNPTMVNPGIGNATNAQMIAGGGINSLNAMSARPAGAYTPAPYKGGSLSKFHYDPNNYQPDVVTPPNPVYHAQYAQGGITSLATGGGISTLGSYSDGGRLLKGPGDGMSDSIPAKIGKKQEARLAEGEFVVPADVVSGLGNGSTDAGAKHLYKMMDKVRHARTGRKSQGKQITAEKYIPA